MKVGLVIKRISQRIRQRGGRKREVRKKSLYRTFLSGGGVLRHRDFYEVSAAFLFSGVHSKTQLKEILNTLTAEFDTTYTAFVYGKDSYDFRKFEGGINPITRDKIIEGIKPANWSLREAFEFVYGKKELRDFFEGSDILILFINNIDSPINLDIKIPEFVVILSPKPLNPDIMGGILKRGIFVELQG